VNGFAVQQRRAAKRLQQRAIVLSSVDFPQPFAPTSTVIFC
jgi:hypothetical protein